MAENKDLKQLRIKTSSLKRIQKEYFEYQKEEEKQRQRILKLQDANADEHDINKQNEVLQETLQMYPNIVQRLTDSVNDLQNWLVSSLQLQEDEKDHDPVVGTSVEKNEAIYQLDITKQFLATVNPAQ